MAVGWVTEHHLKVTAARVADRLGSEDAERARSEFCFLVEAVVYVAYFPTPVSTSGTPYRRFDVPTEKVAAMLDALPLHFLEVDAGPFCEAMREELS
jgi:hypothetical protein